MGKNDKKDKEISSQEKAADDKEKKKRLNTFAYYLGWIAFFSALGSAFVKLVEKWEPPDKDAYYK